MRLIITAILGTAGLGAQVVRTVTFENPGVAPRAFANVIPGGPFGPAYSLSGATFGGGVILNESVFLNAATTKLYFAVEFAANLYCTTDREALQGGSTLPGTITATFASAQSFLRFDIVNGAAAATFTVTAFDAARAAVATSSIALAARDASGATGTLTVSGPDIRSITITSNQQRGAISFAIDTLTFMAATNPVTASARVIADSITGYSGTQGRNGWSYGTYQNAPGTSFTEFAIHKQGCGENDELQLMGFVWCPQPFDYLALWHSGGHPTGPWAVRRWRSSVTANLLIIGKLAKANIGGGDGVVGRILVDGREVYSRAVAGTDADGADYSVSVAVTTGSFVDFALDSGTNPRSDWGTFTAVIFTVPGPPTLFSAVSGDRQSVAAGAVAAAPAVVQVTDADRNPVAGVPVTFTGTNATVSRATVTTGADGRASVQVTAGNVVGPASVAASAQGLTAIAFTFTVTAGAGSPVITNVVNGASFLTGIASGGWVTIEGQNLARSTRTWAGADFVNGALPTRLDGVSVTINGRPAYVYFISERQLNVLPAEDPGVGSVAVVVTTPAGTSAPFVAVKSEVSPGLFLFAPRYPAAVHPNGVYVGPMDLIAGAAFEPAAPLGVILLFGTGFGGTMPPYPAGMVFSGGFPLAQSVRATLGDQPARIEFAGAISPGLYQFNLVVPDLPDGEWALVLEVGNVRIQPGLVITVRRR